MKKLILLLFLCFAATAKAVVVSEFTTNSAENVISVLNLLTNGAWLNPSNIAAGTAAIDVGGNAATVTTVTEAQMTNALGATLWKSITGNASTATTASTATNLAGPAQNFFHNNASMATCTGSNNVGLLLGALDALTTGSYNIAIGQNALTTSQNGNANIAIGNRALTSHNGSGAGNTVIGTDAAYSLGAGDGNTAVGYNAMNPVIGEYNTMLGLNTGMPGMSSGTYTLLLGARAGSTFAGGTNVTIIGPAADMPPIWHSGASNVLNICNLIFAKDTIGLGTNMSTGRVGIKTLNPTYDFEVAGSIRANNGAMRAASMTLDGQLAGAVGLVALSDGLLKLTDNNGLCTSGGILFGTSGNGGSTYYLSTNWPALMVGSSTDRVSFRMQAGTNSSGSAKVCHLDITGSICPSNGLALFQLPWIPTNSIPPSTDLITNYVLLNLSNTVAGTVGGPCYVATNHSAAGSFIILKPTLTQTTWP